MLRPILCLLAGSFAISFFATYFIKRIAPRIGFVDKPGGRKIHANPKPLGGGVAIFLGFALPLLLAVLYFATGTPMAGDPKIQELWDALAQGVRNQTSLLLAFLGAT